MNVQNSSEISKKSIKKKIEEIIFDFFPKFLNFTNSVRKSSSKKLFFFQKLLFKKSRTIQFSARRALDRNRPSILLPHPCRRWNWGFRSPKGSRSPDDFAIEREPRHRALHVGFARKGSRTRSRRAGVARRRRRRQRVPLHDGSTWSDGHSREAHVPPQPVRVHFGIRECCWEVGQG